MIPTAIPIQTSTILYNMPNTY